MSKLKNPQERLDSVIFPLLRDDIATRSLPMANREINSLTDSVVAIRDQLQVLTRQSGFLDDSAVVVSELLDVVDPVVARLSSLEEVVEILSVINREGGTLSGNVGTYSNGATITNWTTAIINDDPNRLLQIDPITGTITFGLAGFYVLFAYVEYTGLTKNDYYGARLNVNGSIFYLGTQNWDVKAPRMVNSVSVVALAAENDVVSMEMFAPDSDATISAASFGARLLL